MAITFFVITVAASGLLSLVLYASRETQGLSFSIMSVVVGVVTLSPLIRAIQKQEYDKIKTAPVMVGLMTFLFWGIGSIGLFFHPEAWLAGDSGTVFPRVLLYVTIGYVFFFLGYHFLPYPQKQGQHHYIWYPSVAGKFLVLFSLFIWWGRYRLASWGLTFSWYQSSIWRLNFVDKSFVQLIRTMQFLIVPALAVLYYRSRNLGLEHQKWRFIARILIAAEFVYYFLSGSKTALAWAIISLMIVVIEFRRRIPFRVIIATILIFVFVVSPLVTAIRIQAGLVSFRARYGNHIELISTVFPQGVRLLFRQYSTLLRNTLSNLSTRFNPIQLLSAIVIRVERDRFALLKGQTFLDMMPVLIPRIIWPSKPPIGGDDPEVTMLKHFRYPVVDTMHPPTTELYANFSIMGVAIGMMIYGMWLYGIYWLLFKRLGGGDAALVSYVASFSFLMAQTGFIGGIIAGIRWTILMWLVCYVISAKSQRYFGSS